MNSPNFATTRWSLVLAAGQADEAHATRDALEALCVAYWYPVYAYVRRRVPQAEDAQEMTQAFFADFLERKAVAAANPERGRFRSFLLTSCQNFMHNAADRARAIKRGGNRRTLSLDFASGEQRMRLEPAERFTPERWFEREWALTLLERVLTELKEEFDRSGRAAHFAALKPFLGGAEHSVSHAELAAQLGISEGAARVAAHRVRRRYRELLRAEIAETVAGEEEVDDEIRRLFTALATA
jgi:RNA polymerase sigma-70 factor (ECF subfamily)